MGVYKMPAVFSITCDKCGYGFATYGEAETVSEQVSLLTGSGWECNHKNILCPYCVTEILNNILKE